MATKEENLDEYIRNLSTSVDITDIAPVFQWASDTVSIGTSHPSYGAVPGITTGNVIGGVGISPTWTTTTNNTGGYTFNANQTAQTTLANGQGGKVHIQGKDADLVIGDKSMKAWMEKVEERLNILTPNSELEKEWDELRRLGERYRKLEKKCREKADMWAKLKSMPAPGIE